MEKGQKWEVLIEPDVFRDPATGVVQEVHSMTVWADEGLQEIIAAVPGVRNVIVPRDETTCYHVYLDHRFGADYVGKEIEAAIMCR